MIGTRDEGRPVDGWRGLTQGRGSQSRRQILAGSGALVVAGCAKPCPPPLSGMRAGLAALVDGHCHLFNGKDLSTVRFLSYVVARHYPEQSELKATGVEDPDWVDLFFETLLAVAGAGSAPSARTELAVLEGRALSISPGEEDREPRDPAEAQAQMVERFTAFLGGRSYLGRQLSDGDKQAEAELRQLLLRAAGDPRPVGETGLKALEPDRRAIVLKAMTPDPSRINVRADNPALRDIYLPGVLEFVKQLKRFRHCLVDELAHLHRDGSQQDPQLLAPAMVDFGRWLREDPEAGSTFADQVKLWPAISRRTAGPAVHGYVAFCPLRQVQFEAGRFGQGDGQIRSACGDVEPLALVDGALSQGGFIGVKVYPPMGFRAATNVSRSAADHPFPLAVLKDVYGYAPADSAENARMHADLGRRLDAAMARLVALCRHRDAVILAHGGNSVGANCRTGELADPYYWKPLFDRDDAPPIMLAHFGSFAYWSADPSAPGRVSNLASASCDVRQDRPPLENTWEAWIARYIQANPGKPVFADISYFSEALATGEADAAKKNFQALLNSGFTSIREHLVFGTDWVMLAQLKGAEVYSERVRRFVHETFGEAWVEPIMRTNFLRYAALRKDSASFQRLAKVYRGDAALTARLAAACA